MKQSLVAVLAAAMLVTSASPASAAPQRPTVEILGVTVEQNWEGQWEHVFDIDAHDPDGVITEVTVQFGDRSVAFAHTYCVIFGPGEVAHMRIGHVYSASGNYIVRAWATSVPECSEWGFEHHQTSAPDVERFLIQVA